MRRLTARTRVHDEDASRMWLLRVGSVWRCGGEVELVQRPAAEILYADELARLAQADAKAPRPGNWKLTPASVLKFILGDEAVQIRPKFVGKRSLLERCIATFDRDRLFDEVLRAE